MASTWGDPYPLDDANRQVENLQKPLVCHREELEVYRGTYVTLSPVTVHPAFIERLQRFEATVAEVGQEVYGRPPNQIRHYGGYSCRRSTNRPSRLSEHALGNAIDIYGFDFPPLSLARDSPNVESESQDPFRARELPPVVQGAFSVRVVRHWDARGSAASGLHRLFLRELTNRLVDSKVFRVSLGPSHPGHEDHLHFDMAPRTYTHL